MSTVLGGSQDSGSQATGQGDGGSPSAAGGAAAASGVVSTGSTAGGEKSWRDALSENIRENPTLKVYTTVEALAQSHIHAQSQIGKKGVILPTEKSSEDDWKRYFKEIGQPELDKFEIKLPDGFEADATTMKGAKEAMHKAGLLPKQAQPIFDWYIKTQKEQAQASAKKAETDTNTALADYRKECGNGYDRQVALANYVVKDVIGLEFAKHLTTSGKGNDVNLIRAFAKLGELMGGDMQIRGEAGGKFGQTPKEIQGEIEKLQAHPAWFDSKHSEHGRINRELAELYQQAYPSKTG